MARRANGFTASGDRAGVADQRRRATLVAFVASLVKAHGRRLAAPSSYTALLLLGGGQRQTWKDVWATFPRQEEATKFAKQHTDVRIFSHQDHFNGTRRFLVSTYQEFWQ
ncbi:hypothetical protein Dimus_014182, partial [Dionaea muscipula]